jgi:F-type H+-transporting ATPase subunit a
VELMGPYAIRQFEVDVLVPLSIYGHDVSFTVSAQAMLTTVIVVGGYLAWATRELKVIPDRLQASAEYLHMFVENMVVRFGGLEAKRALPFFLTMFMFILFGTLIGWTPIKFTFTSHIIVTLALALAVFCYVNFLAFKTQGFGFF